MVSYKDIEEVTPFTIMICPKEQYDWAQSHKMGYQYRFHFLLGMLNGTNGNLNWGGINSLTFQQSKEILFNRSLSDYDIESKNAFLEDRFILPHGHCKELKNYDMTKAILISNSGNISVFVTDPLITLYYRISESSMIGDKQNLVAKPGKYNDFLTFVIDVHETHLYKKKPGEECTDYGETEEFLSYEHCKHSELVEMLIPEINCLPPWMSPVNQCEGTVRKGN